MSTCAVPQTTQSSVGREIESTTQSYMWPVSYEGIRLETKVFGIALSAPAEEPMIIDTKPNKTRPRINISSQVLRSPR